MSLVPLVTCGSAEEASALRALLDAHAIPCVVQGEHHRALLGMLGAYVEVRLLVPAIHRPSAARLIAPEPRAVDDAEGGPDPADARRRRILAWAALGLLTGPSLVAVVLNLLLRWS
jgi:hypothetical protein